MTHPYILRKKKKKFKIFEKKLFSKKLLKNIIFKVIWVSLRDFKQLIKMSRL